MRGRAGTVVAAIALWLAIVASTSVAAWVVIDRAGRDAFLTEGPRPELTRSGPRESTLTNSLATTETPEDATASSSAATPVTPSPTSSRPRVRQTTGTPAPPVRPSSQPSPPPSRRASATTSAGPSPSAPSTPSAPSAVSDSVSVTGGSVGVTCQGSTLTLRFATPRNGWSYTLERTPSTVEVSFRQNAGEQESEVHAVCSQGAPAFETRSSDAAHDATERDGTG